MLRSSFTLCWVGFVLSSPAPRRYGTSEMWMYMTWSSPTCRLNCRMASRKGRLSMSPTVPPTSTIMTSACLSRATRVISSRISLVTWGITCTVPPRYSPRRSRAITAP